MMYSYTDSEMKKLLSTATILTDTREQENSHIISYFDSKKINHKKKALKTGDYSISLPANPELGIIKEMFFPVTVERKAHLDELIQSIKENRFENELIRGTRFHFYLIVEDDYRKLLNGEYRSEYKPQALLARLKSFEMRYNFTTVFIDKKLSGNWVYHSLYYYLREQLKCHIA